MITFLTLYFVLLQLYSAALKYGLEALSRHCEILCVRKMHFDNCVMIYKNAKVRFSSQTNVATLDHLGSLNYVYFLAATRLRCADVTLRSLLPAEPVAPAAEQ